MLTLQFSWLRVSGGGRASLLFEECSLIETYSYEDLRQVRLPSPRSGVGILGQCKVQGLRSGD